MTFDPTQPTDTTFIRNLGIVIRPNWAAIQEGDSSFAPYSINYFLRDGTAPTTDPSNVSNVYAMYSKEDGSVMPVRQELFVKTPNPENTIIQMTKGVPINDTNGETFLFGNIGIKWGKFTTSTNPQTISYTGLTPGITDFTTATYSVVLQTTVGGNSGITAVSKTGFTVSASPGLSFYFVAIGS